MVSLPISYQIENAIKQGTESLRQGENRSKLLYKDFVPLKKEINELREELGLEKLASDDLDTLELVQSSSDARFVVFYCK